MTALALISPAATTSCAHCGAAITSGEQFCCAGCNAAYGVIQSLGLGRFYTSRAPTAEASLRPDEGRIADYASYVRSDDANRRTLMLGVEGLSCAACVWLIESVLGQEPAILSSRVNLTTRRLTLKWEGPIEDANRYAGLIARLGFRLAPYDPATLATADDSAESGLLRCLAVAGFAAANVMLLSVATWWGHVEDMGPATRDLLHWVSALIAAPAIAYAGRPFFKSAYAALSHGRTNMDVPISIGVTLATALSFWETATGGDHAFFDSAVTLLFFLLIGRYLDTLARGRARSAAQQLLLMRATSVTVIRDDGTTAARPANQVKPGEIVLVAAGERVGVDGVVIDGRSDLDASLITGESAPKEAAVGDALFAGMINLSAPLRLRARASGEGTLLAEIARLMEAAEHGRGRFVALADRVARRYAPAVHSLAALTLAGWWLFGDVGLQGALFNAIAVLIITCPCALALAVPVVQVAACSRLLKHGILLKSGTALERIAKIDTVVFDKTGTLTAGRPELIQDGTFSPNDLARAAALAQASRHPLAQAIARAAPFTTPLPDVHEVPGSGLVASVRDGEMRLGNRSFCGIEAPEIDTGHSEIWLTGHRVAPVRFTFRDQVRPDAPTTIAALKARGCAVQLLSGDLTATVDLVSRACGIDIWFAQRNPAAKCAHLASLRARGRVVLMVGDGLNDAAALTAADASASPSTAADISQTAADLVFQGQRLEPVVEIVDVARASSRLAAQNLALAVIYNAFAVPLAMAGYVTPLVAAIAMSSSSLLVIGNALRLARRKETTP